MTSAYVSGSRLQRTQACPGSAALPVFGHESEKADVGSAFHEHNRDRTLLLPGDAAARIGQHAEAWGLSEKAAGILAARARNWEWHPPPGTLAEIPLGLLEDGTVVRVEGGKGVYTGPRSMRVATSVDFFWSEPTPLYREGEHVRCPADSILWGVDLKSGKDTWVAPVERNLQALCAAVLPALWTGARRAVPAIVFPSKGPGTWDVPPAPLDEAGILAGRDLLLEIAARANEQRARYAAGRPLKLVEGAHCAYCDSESYCPAKLATLKAILDSPDPFAGIELTDDEASRLAELLPSFERIARMTKAALGAKVTASGRPVRLGDGTVWGPHEHPKKKIAPWVAFQALKAVVGDEHARTALTVEISDASISRAVKAFHAETGVERQVAPTVRAIFRDVILAGGISTESETWWERYRPSAPAPELAARVPGTAAAPEEIDGDE
jgi:hypothetical protein